MFVSGLSTCIFELGFMKRLLYPQAFGVLNFIIKGVTLTSHSVFNLLVLLFFSIY